MQGTKNKEKHKQPLQLHKEKHKKPLRPTKEKLQRETLVLGLDSPKTT